MTGAILIAAVSFDRLQQNRGGLRRTTTATPAAPAGDAEPGPAGASRRPAQLSKTSSGSSAETSAFGTSTTSEILRSAATLQSTYAASRVRPRPPSR